DANVAVRTIGEQDQAESIAEIIVRSDPDGRVIRLREVAQVIDGFEDVELISRFNASPAVSVTAYKTADQDAIDIATKVKALVAGKTSRPFDLPVTDRVTPRGRAAMQVYRSAAQQPYAEPPGPLATHNNLARFIEGRLDLLKRNGTWGLLLVFGSLLLFLNWRVAFWVMMGLVLSILGTLVVMKMIGFTLNLITMFGMIVVLGMLVDDAIIVAEHIYTKIEEGMPAAQAAVVGAEAVTWPVVCAIATTIAAFGPLMFIKGRMGDFFFVLPVIVICALSISLFEALSILPAHLAHQALGRRRRSAGQPRAGWFARVRSVKHQLLGHLLPGAYERFLRVAVSYRYVTLAVASAGLLVTLAAIYRKRIPYVHLQKMDAETLLANLEMPVGSPVHQTDTAMELVEGAALGIGEIDSMYTLVGMQFDLEGGTSGLRSHLAQLIMELTPVEQREALGQRNSEQVLRELRRRCGDIPGANSLRFDAIHGGPGGVALQVELSGERLEDLIAVCDNVKQRMSRFAGVFDLSDDFDLGRREVQIELLDSARALGLTTQDLASQVRAAFYGLEARKINRDREDVKIMVRYPPSARRHVYDVESMWIAAPNGELVPFSEVARIREGRSYAAIRRLNQKRTVTITADVDESVGNARMIGTALAGEFPQLRGDREVTMQFGGQRREFAKSFGSLRQDFAVALLLIFALLAALFRSYVQPLIVMTAIPFGLIGAVIGHYVMGYPLTILSLIGLVALTGIVVNDSLILLTFINRGVADGAAPFEAVIAGGKSRLRPIILTSITTIMGLAPLMAERSFQARFLIPMGISISFGLAFATVLTLVVVPSLYLIVADLRRLAGQLVRLPRRALRGAQS
ncbi:MAG: efflux RND transporter permease subunit, partial [Planctomycetota bacterium]